MSARAQARRHLPRACAAAALALAAATPAWAGPADAEQLRPGLYRVGGAVARLGEQGLVIVDTRNAGAYAALEAAVRQSAQRSTALPIRALVITAADAQAQAGTAAGEAAVPAVPQVVQRRALPQRHGGQAPPGFITYDTDYMLRVGGVEVEVEHVGRGRSGVDSVAFFRDLRAIAVGELYTHGQPEPDCATGGSYAGWAAAISHLLYFDFDLAVPSRGAPVGKEQLRELRARLQALAADPSRPACAKG